MHIVIEACDGTPDVDIHVHPNGTFVVRVDGTHAGTGRWDKKDNRLRLSLPSGVFRQPDNENGMSFSFEDR